MHCLPSCAETHLNYAKYNAQIHAIHLILSHILSRVMHSDVMKHSTSHTFVCNSSGFTGILHATKAHRKNVLGTLHVGFISGNPIQHGSTNSTTTKVEFQVCQDLNSQTTPYISLSQVRPWPDLFCEKKILTGSLLAKMTARCREFSLLYWSAVH